MNAVDNFCRDWFISVHFHANTLFNLFEILKSVAYDPVNSWMFNNFNKIFFQKINADKYDAVKSSMKPNTEMSTLRLQNIVNSSDRR